jgi:Ca-activated chloride channel homolog
MRAQTSRSRSLGPAVGVGCGVLAVCVLAAGALGVGAWYFTRPRAAVPEPAVEYLLDASPRMALATEDGTRLSIAQAVLAEIVRPADPAVTAGLRVFGSGALPDACQDTRLLVPLAPASQALISTELSAIQAGQAADAAMAQAMVAAIADLSGAGGPHTLVVVTGGQDSCRPEAGQLIAEEASRAGIALELFVVGYQVTPDEADAIRGCPPAAGWP